MKRKSSDKKTGTFKKARSGSHDAVNRTDVWPPIIDKSKSTGAEKKYVDVDTTIYQVNTTGSITLLNGLSRGDDAAAQRVGRKVTMTSVNVRGYASTESSQNVGGATASTSQMVRCLIVYDSQPNGGTPALVDILKEARPESQLNINNRDRFSVLANWEYAFGPITTGVAGITAADNQAMCLNLYRGGLRMPVIFNSNNNGNATDINTGAIWMVWVGNVAAGTNLDANARVTTRCRYLDA